MRKVYLLLLCCLPLVAIKSQNIIPLPNKINGKKFDLSNIRSIYVEDKSLLRTAEVFNEYLSKTEGLHTLPIEKQKQNALILTLDNRLYKEEQYKIEQLYSNSIKITGRKSGVFYGLMTLLQAMAQQENSIMSIEDEPAFAWRGMHLDVSRHFFDKEFVKKYIDMLAFHKMNTFHWHLTDDQGWRIEIKQFPLLTQLGSKRKETMVGKNFNPYVGDGKPVEGFYTQEDIKEVVGYALDRNVTIVPEIEMPGHAQAALSAYSIYSCSKQRFEPMTTWGVSDDVFCPNDSTFAFLTKVLDEVIELFPSKYIHIGGDEVPKTRWKECAVCQQKIKELGLKNEEELQSHFIKRIDAYLTLKGRSTIGWDEILEGGIAPNAAIMSWRGEEGGIAASKQNHYVVMTPGSHCYFDHYQGNKQTEPLAIGGFTTVEKVYSYNPIPTVLPIAQRKYILGAQGNVWTEYMETPNHVEYMAMPRLCALAEVLWTGNKKPTYSNFVQRLEKHFSFLEKENINYSKAIYDVSMKHESTGGYVFSSVETPFSKGKIYYTTDGANPSVTSTLYTKRIFVNASQTIKAQYFDNGIPVGKINTQQFIIHKGVNKQVSTDVFPSTNSKISLLNDAHVGLLPKNLAEWVAWKDVFPTLTFDMHIATQVNSVSIYVLKEIENNNYLPSVAELQVSDDGKNFKTLTMMNSNEIKNSYNNNGGYVKISVGAKTKFVRIKFTNQHSLENDEKAWLLITEIAID